MRRRAFGRAAGPVGLVHRHVGAGRGRAGRGLLVLLPKRGRPGPGVQPDRDPLCRAADRPPGGPAARRGAQGERVRGRRRGAGCRSGGHRAAGHRPGRHRPGRHRPGGGQDRRAPARGHQRRGDRGKLAAAGRLADCHLRRRARRGMRPDRQVQPWPGGSDRGRRSCRGRDRGDPRLGVKPAAGTTARRRRVGRAPGTRRRPRRPGRAGLLRRGSTRRGARRGLARGSRARPAPAAHPGGRHPGAGHRPDRRDRAAGGRARLGHARSPADGRRQRGRHHTRRPRHPAAERPAGRRRPGHRPDARRLGAAEPDAVGGGDPGGRVPDGVPDGVQAVDDTPPHEPSGGAGPAGSVT